MINVIDKVWTTLVSLIWSRFERLWNFLVHHNKFVYMVLILILVLPYLFN